MKRLFASLLVACVLAPVAGTAQDKPSAKLLRFPAVSKDKIVFSYANDLWTVPRTGGMATPLAGPPGKEAFPLFSPDGSLIAFRGNYEGNFDIYVVPTGGGEAKRLTYHPSPEKPTSWTPDGRVVYSMFGLTGNRVLQLFSVPAAGGVSQKLPVPYGDDGAVSPDGQWLAYTPYNGDSATWKRYRGGLAPDIWLFNLRTHVSKKITDWEGTDTIPMWNGKTVYYISDAGANHRLNIWSFDTASGKRKQVTNFSDYDVKWPSMGPDAIVFQYGSDLMLLDLASGQSHAVSVTVPGDKPVLRPKSIDTSRFIDTFDISATGKRAVIGARGDIWTSPTKDGAPRNMTRTDGVAERDATWSPDGRWIAYFSDATGEYELYVTQSDGQGETRKLSNAGPKFKFRPTWSPDSKWIQFSDNAGNLYLTDVAAGTTKIVDRDPQAQPTRVSWSNDSRWLAYSRTTDGRMISSAIWIYNIESGEKRQATSGMFFDTAPAFDRKGEWLYFTSMRAQNPDYDDFGVTWVYNNSGVLLAAPLRKDIKSPYLPKSDEETWKDDKKKDEEKKEDKPKDTPKPDAVADDGVSGTWTGKVTGGAPVPPEGLPLTMEIKLGADNKVTGSVQSPQGSASIETGVWDPASKTLTLTMSVESQAVTIVVKIEGDKMSGTASVAGQTYSVSAERTGKPGAAGATPTQATDAKPADKVAIDFEGFERRAIQLPVKTGNFSNLQVSGGGALLYVRTGRDQAPGIFLFDIHDDKKEEKSVAAGAAAFEISGDGKKMIVIRGGTATIQDAGPGSGDSVMTSGMNATIDPKAEWKQMFREAWRLERDYFYDPNMHGVNWQKVYENYSKLVDDCSSREDVGFLIGEMIAELNVGHAYYGGGDVEGSPGVGVGLLGADFALENGAFRITRIHEGGPWDSDARGPLSQPGVDVKEGDYLLAVNGVAPNINKDVWAAFTGLVGRTTTLTVSDKPSKDDKARQVLIKPLPSEEGLRYRSWIEKNRAYVDKATNGRVGYIYVPNTGADGQSELYRQFISQMYKDALIIDERWNGGGQVPDRFVELLARKPLNGFATREAGDGTWPVVANFGPKCMLINGLAGSGGDAFPSYFRQFGVGKLIGTRTWGGLVGLSGNPGLIDGAMVTVPTFGYYKLNGTWGIEGHGVDPDFEVVDDPAKMWDGGDPQLDFAIKHMLEELKTHAYKHTPKPKYPDRSGMGIPEKDR